MLAFFGQPGGPAVDSKRRRRSARSRHDWENQRAREFVSLVEAAGDNDDRIPPRAGSRHRSDAAL